MRTFLHTAFCLACLGLSSHSFAIYETEISHASTWLEAQQNADGSWGAGNAARLVFTAEAVDALRASGLRNSAYYKGITWLENHASDNADYQARRALILNAHGDDVSSAVNELESSQNTSISGRDAWGSSATYLQAPVDTAIVLKSLGVIGSTADLQAAIDYLKAAQISSGNQGWPVALESAADAFSTAMAVKALVALQGVDGSVTTNINNAVAALDNLVTTFSPTSLQAHAAHAAYLAGDNVQANGLLSNLSSTQAVNGSWNTQIYDTALAMRAMAAAGGLDTPANQSDVLVPDANLRAAINLALGRNVMDTIDRAQLLLLSDLVAVNQGIDDLTGLEFAANLVNADLRNNNISSTAPVDSLPALVTLQISGNPVAGGGFDSDEDIPTLPEWGMIIMACLLMWQMIKRQRENDQQPPTGFAA